VSFTAPASDGGSAITGYTATSSPGGISASCSVSPCVVTGLTNGTSYTFTVHATNVIGDSAESTASAAVVPSAPSAPTAPTAPSTPALSAPTAIAGRASATVTWTASTDPAVTGYTVTAAPGPATCSTSSPTVTSCIIGGTAGVTYTYTVVAHGAGSDSAASPASNPVTPAAPTVPAADPSDAPATLTTTQGVLSQVEPGQQFTVIGSGFLAFSSATVILHSDPLVLGTTVADGNGNVQLTVTLPAAVSAGAHDVVASGVDAGGNVRFIRMPVTVAAATPAVAGEDSSVAGDTLAFTGTDASDGVITALLLAGTGALLVLSARRRERHARSA
jgi:titin